MEKMTTNWKQTSVALDADEAKMLKWLLKATGLRQNGVIRRAVRDLYAAEQNKRVL